MFNSVVIRWKYPSLWCLKIILYYCLEISKPKLLVFWIGCCQSFRKMAGAYSLRYYFALTDMYSDALLVDATLNTLSILIRARPHISNKILNVILNFNPLKLANSPMTPKLRVMVKSMEKTTRLLLINISKRYACLFHPNQRLADSFSDPQNPLTPKIHQYIERMMRSRSEIFDEATRKRGPPESTDGLDAAKRQKLGAQVPTGAPKFQVPPLTPGLHTIAELFTVTTDEALKAFDVAQLSEDLVVKIGITILQRIDADTLNQAVDVSSAHSWGSDIDLIVHRVFGKDMSR
jgi:symplekin